MEETRVRGQEPARGLSEQQGAAPLDAITTSDSPRVPSSDAEFDRVLGGGVVPGSLILLGGEPGVGKSTLLLQLALRLQDKHHRILYVSGEESPRQIKLRAERLQGSIPPELRAEPAASEIFVLGESNLERIIQSVQRVLPAFVIVDSVQTTYSETLDSAPGTISQDRHVATRLLSLAKMQNIPVFLVGHVTKDGSIAGPKALEHIVDVVLYFEGERHHNHRIIRAIKNRFGPANEIGVFEMTRMGLLPVSNPSTLFLSERDNPAVGSAVVSSVEGTRPLMVEIQSLVSSTRFSTSRRLSSGIDYNRIHVMVAMMERQLSIPLMGCDIYVNTAGGLQVSEPAADLGIVGSIMSSFRNQALPPRLVLIGEVALSGEVRPVAGIQARVQEASSMGFLKCVVPAGNLPVADPKDGLDLVGAETVSDLGQLLFDSTDAV